ncbi:MAG: hypothetical protein V4652_13155 [Bacteroidota bacterium]
MSDSLKKYHVGNCLKTKKPNPEASGLFGFCGTSSPEASGEPGMHGLSFG